VTHLLSKLGKALFFPLATTLLACLTPVQVCAASVTAPSVTVPKSRQTDQKPVKKARAKPAEKKQQAQKGAAPQPVVAAAPVSAAPAIPPADLALKASPAISVEVPQPAPAAAPVSGYTPRVNPYLVNVPQVAPAPAPVASAPSAPGGSGFKIAFPQIPLFEQSILPKIKTVYPTGEKPLVVLTFKCPTELVGIDTPSTVILHKAVNGGMDLVNKTNLLSFNMQQVCQ
jgi:hypothetical protein